MIQILLIVLAGLVLVMGTMALIKGEIQISGSKKWTGQQATVTGIIVILVGVGLMIFALVGLPLMFAR